MYLCCNFLTLLLKLSKKQSKNLILTVFYNNISSLGEVVFFVVWVSLLLEPFRFAIISLSPERFFPPRADRRRFKS